MKEKEDYFLIALKRHKLEMFWCSIICFIGVLISLLFNKAEITGIMSAYTIILFVLFLIAKKQIKTYETNRNTRKH